MNTKDSLNYEEFIQNKALNNTNDNKDDNIDDSIIPRENENINLQNIKIYSSNSAINFTFDNPPIPLIKYGEDSKDQSMKSKSRKITEKKKLPDPKIAISYLEKSNNKNASSVSKTNTSPTSN